MPYPGLLHPEPCSCGSPLLTRTSTGDTQTQFWLSLCGVSGSWCEQGLFEPSEHNWQVWGLTPNVISFLLPSCWSFSFALGCGLSFSGGIQHSPIKGCSVASCNFGVLVGENGASLVAQFVKNPPAMQETLVQFLGWDSMLKNGKSYPLQKSGLENSVDCIVHGVAKSQTGLSDSHF